MFFRKTAQKDDGHAPGHSPTVVGPGTTVEGNLDSDGEIRIEGTVRGTVRCATCIVGTDGLVEGDIAAHEVVVSGRVAGPIRGRHVHLRHGAQVDGDIVNQTLAVDGGAELNGAVWRSEDPLGGGRAETPALPPPASGALFSESLWPRRDNDDFRPLQAIRPKR